MNKLGFLNYGLITVLIMTTLVKAQFNSSPTLKIGDKAPPIKLQSWVRGEPLTRFENGKVYVIDFWTTWCNPCKASFPLMKKALEKYSNTDVEFLFVNTWERTGDPNENAKKYLKENNYPFHCVLDLDGKVTAKFGISGVPTKVFIDKEGMIRYTAVGFEADTMLEEIDTVINLIK